MKIPRNCPKYGQMEIEIPDEDLVSILQPIVDAAMAAHVLEYHSG